MMSDRADEIAQSLYQMAQHAETQCGIETIAGALRDFAKAEWDRRIQELEELAIASRASLLEEKCGWCNKPFTQCDCSGGKAYS